MTRHDQHVEVGRAPFLRDDRQWLLGATLAGRNRRGGLAPPDGNPSEDLALERAGCVGVAGVVATHPPLAARPDRAAAQAGRRHGALALFERLLLLDRPRV